MEVTIYDKVFSDKDFDYIKKESDNVFKSKNFISNTFWSKDIKDYSKEVYIHNIENSKLKNIITKELYNIGIKNHIKSLMFYYWEQGTYIPWHKDSSHGAGMTIYLNDSWNYENGGLFLYELNNKIETIVPKKNLGVFQIGGVPHSTTIVSEKNKIRKTLQVFFDKQNINDSYII